MTKATAVRGSFSASTLALMVLAAIVVAGVVYNVYVPLDTSAVTEKREMNKAAGTQILTGKNHKISVLASYKQLAVRPLFNPDRKPFSLAKVIKRKKPSPQRVRRKPPPPKPFRLLGVLINATNKKALIGAGSVGTGKWLTQGGTIYGWKVKAIHHDRVIMEKRGSSREIALYAKPTKR